MADFIVSKLAYSKMLLHCAKYPHTSINGVLISEKSKSKESKCVKYVDAVPLFHLTLSLVPMLEVALTQVGMAVDRLFQLTPFVLINITKSDPIMTHVVVLIVTVFHMSLSDIFRIFALTND